MLKDEHGNDLFVPADVVTQPFTLGPAELRLYLKRGGDRPQSHPVHDRVAQRKPPRRSEARVSVHIHPGPPAAVSRRRHTTSGRARTSPQTFHNVCRQLN
jgi:hypothetical protein